MKHSKILCIDFDGVLHSYESGWKGVDVIPDPPVPGALIWLRALTEDPDFEPQIYSSRSKEIRQVKHGDPIPGGVADAGVEGGFVHIPIGIVAMKHWLGVHGLEEEYIDQLEFPTQKPPAFLTIDDRAICFQGRFPTLEELGAFKPWNKRGSEMRGDIRKTTEELLENLVAIRDRFELLHAFVEAVAVGRSIDPRQEAEKVLNSTTIKH